MVWNVIHVPKPHTFWPHLADAHLTLTPELSEAKLNTLEDPLAAKPRTAVLPTNHLPAYTVPRWLPLQATPSS